MPQPDQPSRNQGAESDARDDLRANSRAAVWAPRWLADPAPGTNGVARTVSRAVLACGDRGKPPDAATAPRPVAAVAAGAGRASLATGAVRLAGGPAIERSTAEPGGAVARGVTPAFRIRARTRPPAPRSAR